MNIYLHFKASSEGPFQTVTAHYRLSHTKPNTITAIRWGGQWRKLRNDEQGSYIV